MDPVAQNILDAAYDEFAEHGLAGARVDAIAARTSTSKRMLYYHFRSKEGLYAAVLAYAYAQVRGEPPTMDAQEPMDALRAYVGYVFDLHARHPRFVRLVMGENLLRGRFICDVPDVRSRNLGGLERLRGVILRGQAAGVMRKDLDAMEVYANIVGLAFHFVSNRASFSFIFEQDRQPAEVFESRRRSVIDTIERQVMQLPNDRLGDKVSA